MSSIDPPDFADAVRRRRGSTDPTRWVTLAITIVSAFIVVLDNTVLNVAIPTILREFDTSLSSLEWVITGYALTFATLLIIGGRLGDVYGHRRVFIIGAALFGVGSLIAALSQGVPELILGEAIIEGIGASLMLPATLAILSGTFHGRERATAFAAWGATAGVAVAVGPVVGGFLTTNYSWRWAFGINVIIAPLAIVGALLFMKVAPRRRPQDRPRRPRRGADRRRDVPPRVRVERRRDLRVVGADQGLLDRGPRRVAHDEAHLDHPDHVPRLGRHPHLLLLPRTVEGAQRSAIRCSSSSTCGCAPTGTGC